MRRGILAAAAASMLIAPASAALPIISGKYATNYNEICQANNPNIPSPGNGATYTQTLIADFNPAKGTVTLTGTSVYGPLLGTYTPLAPSTISTKTTYTNTATTLTIGNVTFNIVYGSVKNGIAQSAVFGGISSGGCAASATAIRQ